MNTAPLYHDCDSDFIPCKRDFFPAMTIKHALGLMSGTSMDGIDVALLMTDGEALVEPGPVLALDYPADVRRRLTDAMDDARRMLDRTSRPGCLEEVEALVTNWHAQAVEMFLAEHGVSAADVDLIGFHGQTVLHRPEIGLTVQLGDGRALAARTGIDTVFDFRAADLRAGGQGAPLVPVFHQALAAHLDHRRPVAFVNIGGIANITFVGADDTLIAFDTGPGNNLIDQWLQSEAGIPIDMGGTIASEGQVNATVLDRYLSEPFFELPVPKSLDRGDFRPLKSGELDLSDGARTLATLTAKAIWKAIEHLPRTPKTWIICGGGRLNATIMADLTVLAAEDDAEVITAERAGLDGDLLEAQAFAYLAVRSSRNLPLTFPATTGCERPVTGGVFASSR